MTGERAREILLDVTFPHYTWLVDGGERTYLQATFTAPHCRTGLPEVQFTRKWYVSREATRSEVVQTAFKCVLTSIEHEAREVFRYRGQPIFGPHYDVDGLAALCIAHALDEREAA